MPIYKSEEAVESGFGQVREALLAFEGDVVGFEEGQWGGTLIDQDTGKPVPPKEYVEVKCINVKITEVSEELTMIPTEWNFRVNTSMSKGSFWVDDFLKSADDNNLILPEGIIGKRVAFKRIDKPYDIKGKKGIQRGFVISKVLGNSSAPAPAVVKVAAAPLVTSTIDLMAVALDLAIGKTEAQFRSAISLHPQFANSPLLPLAKTGGITSALIADSKIALVEGKYQKL